MLFCARDSGLSGHLDGIWCSSETRSASGDLSREVCFEGDETAVITSSTPRENVGRVKGGPERIPAKMGRLKSDPLVISYFTSRRIDGLGTEISNCRKGEEHRLRKFQTEFFLKKKKFFFQFACGFGIQGIILFLEKIKSSHFAPL